MAIHAATVKKAAHNNLALVMDGDRVQVLDGKKILAFDTDPKKALSKAIARKEEERLRKVDPRPQDREPLLVIPGGVTAPRLEPVKALIVEAVTPPVVIKGNIIKSKYRDRYKKNGDYSCGDDIAAELKAYVTVVKDHKPRVDLTRLKEVAVTNNVWKDSYDNLNPGQRRMTIGNCLRSKFKAGATIDIGGAILVQEFAGL